MVVFGDPNNYVYHIRHAATTLGAAIEFLVHLGGHDELPWISAQQLKDDILDLLGRDHIALADEHCAAMLKA